jgi:D-alanine transfer protein
LTQNTNSLAKVSQLTKTLPARPNAEVFDQLAYSQGQSAASNNPFSINNHVWDSNLKHRYKRMQGYQAKVSYLQSPEYADFQLLLNQFAANHDDVTFIIQPVNASWYQYTGLSLSMLQQFSQKISKQLRSQGFNNIVDYTNEHNTPYFVGDTDHFGTQGWLAVDRAISDFMKQPMKANYTLNNQKYLSQSWQMTTGE